MHRSAPRLSRILACAAVPVMLVVAGCSSDSGDAKASDSSTSPSAQKSEPEVEPAKFTELPDACTSIARKTIEDLVPKTKTKGGTPGKSSDTTSRGGCSWNGLDDNGVKGSQYRWLDVGFTRFDSDQSLGSGAKRATDEYTKQVSKAQATEGAEKPAAKPVAALGEQATAVTYGLTKSKEDFEYATIVARTGNVVVSVTYNGAGFAGAKTPSAADILKDAQKAAKEAVAAVGADAGDSDASSASPSASASASASAKS
ncbi:DUF3558 domain-containing protein [Streptomyces sp. NPDC002455]|uniref:DUF3558 domain-containing protein n=1 Tax=Streptomyces sp. NBC_00148 TaxID=2903626 RepID=A0AAU1LT11_9ACTN